MTYLIIGGTGTVGKDVVAGLLRHTDSTVRVLTRSEKHAKTLPEGATAVIGDLEDPNTYDEIFEGIDRPFLLNPVDLTELHQGLAPDPCRTAMFTSSPSQERRVGDSSLRKTVSQRIRGLSSVRTTDGRWILHDPPGP